LDKILIFDGKPGPVAASIFFVDSADALRYYKWLRSGAIKVGNRTLSANLDYPKAGLARLDRLELASKPLCCRVLVLPEQHNLQEVTQDYVVKCLQTSDGVQSRRVGHGKYNPIQSWNIPKEEGAGLSIVFAEITAAIKAKRILADKWIVEYGVDPCAGSLDELHPSRMFFADKWSSEHL
jgi:hypothetical protein